MIGNYIISRRLQHFITIYYQPTKNGISEECRTAFKVIWKGENDGTCRSINYVRCIIVV